MLPSAQPSKKDEPIVTTSKPTKLPTTIPTASSGSGDGDGDGGASSSGQGSGQGSGKTAENNDEKDKEKDEKDDGLSGGAIAGIAVGGVFTLALVMGAVVIYNRRRGKVPYAAEHDDNNDDTKAKSVELAEIDEGESKKAVTKANHESIKFTENPMRDSSHGEDAVVVQQTRSPAAASDAHPGCAWEAIHDASTGRYYFHNVRSGATTWEMPADYVQRGRSSTAISMQ